MAKRVTEEEKTEMRRLRMQGMFYREIAAIVDRSETEVRYVLNPEAAAKNAVTSIAYYRAHKKRAAVYRKTYRVEKAACNAAHYQAHKDEKAAYYQEHRAKIASRMVLYGTAYRQTFKGKALHLARNAKRRALKRGSRIDSDNEALKAIYARAASPEPVRCYLCDKLIPQGERHVDHIIPLSRGGAHILSNLAIACAICNESKGNKIPEEYQQYQLETAPA